MRIPKLFFCCLLFNSNLFAQDIKLIGSIEHTLQTPQSKNLDITPAKQEIKLLKIELSNSAIEVLHKRADATLKKPNTLIISRDLPSKIDLGMNGVPVLNQGKFNTCVTFAITAAFDAALNKGDYISQLCQLQLNLHLGKNGYIWNGWDGASGRQVLSQIEHFGIVSKEKQKTIGCGGVTEYPGIEQPVPENGISLEEFHQISENLEENGVIWSPILDMYQATMERTDTEKTVSEIKEILNQKDRVTFAVFLIDLDLGFMGAVGTHSAPLDTWVFTPEIARDIYLHPVFAGHEMIITGYDDDAIATDQQGHPHKGLFILRNSWGDKFGNRGTFYMSYDYFKVLTYEAQRIRKLPDGANTK